MLHKVDFFRKVEDSFDCKPYQELLIEICDENGCLSEEQVNKLLNDHGHTFDAVLEDPCDSNLLKLKARNAHELLFWLGYRN